MSTETNLINTFKERDDTFQEMTARILSDMSLLLKCTEELLGKIPNEQYTDGSIVWQDVVLLANDNIGIMGEWVYNIGAKVLSPDGNEIEITPAVLDYFKLSIRLNVPLSIAISQDRDVVIGFLNELYARELERQEESENIIDQIRSMISDGEEDDDEDEGGSEAFDTDSLNDEQKAALNSFYNTQPKGKMH